MALPRSGPASRAVALDLMLRTFMNSGEFQTSNPKIWDNIAKLVPGTTPQQCCQRWEELRAVSQSAVVGDYTGLAAQGRPISGHGKRQMTKLVRSMFHTHTEEGVRPRSACERSRSALGRARPSSGLGRAQSGQFVASFCQSVLGGGKASDTAEETSGTQMSSGDSVVTSASNAETLSRHESCSSVGEHGPSMIIHVCDEAKKMKRDFTCPRNLLITEMRYFAEYLTVTSDSQLWDEVDISVHCDVPVFEWLMSYTKRGMMEGPCGEELIQPLPRPQLEPSNAVSILISSEFLKMDTLVDECLDYCHKHISEVVASPCNMGCISEQLIARLAGLFTPLELEQISDKKDKTKSRLFAQHLQQLFKPHPLFSTSGSSAATLYRCKYCSRLLTTELQSKLPCTAKRLSVGRDGGVLYTHERNPSWDVNHFIHTLQQEGLSVRDIYWRIWGAVNWLECVCCHSVFQCCHLNTCAYHPQAAAGHTHQYMCCQQQSTGFTPLPHSQSGCAMREHCCTPCKPVSSDSSLSSCASDSSGTPSSREAVYSTLLLLRDAVCVDSNTAMHRETPLQHCAELSNVLQREEHKTHSSLSREASRQLVRENSSSEVLASSSSGGRQALLTQGTAGQSVATDAKIDSDLEEDEVDSPPQVQQLVQPPRARRNKQAHSLRQRHSRHELHSPATQVEWIWDNKKSKRWNQDMQRESDERRLASLASQLNTMNSTPAENSKDKVVVFSGGLFSRLEAEFRAQQTAANTGTQAAQKQVTRLRTKS